MGPWLVKNVIDTGNPVYPLADSVFHGRFWDQALEQKWSTAHGRRPVTYQELIGFFDRCRRSFRLAIAALRGPGATGIVAARFATARLGALGTRGLPVRNLVALDSPAGSVLAAAPSALAILAGLGADWVRNRAWSARAGSDHGDRDFSRI